MNAVIKRTIDILLSFGGLITLAPFLLLIAVLIKIESRGPVFFRQLRVGQYNRDFLLYKFRSMSVHAERSGQLTIGMRDSRITRVGYIIRKYKLDEVPQLWNVLKGDMSFVGPRPEVRKYVSLYTPAQLKVLSVKPGITDYASVKYFNENEILGRSPDPEASYIKEIMPEKLKINLHYIDVNTIAIDFKILMATFIRYFSHPSD